MNTTAQRLLLLMLWLCPTSHLLGQASSTEQRKRELLEGTHVFRRLLHDHQFSSLTAFKELADAPEQSLLVILGELKELDHLRESTSLDLERFVRRGGAVLLASDRAVTDDSAREQLITLAGVEISQERFLSPLCYQERRFCPLLLPYPNARLQLLGETQRSGRGTLTVYANAPAKLRRRNGTFPPGVHPELMLPPFSRIEYPNGRSRPDSDPFPLFGVAGELGEGRVFVMADHSVFINQMMMPQDTNNVEFTDNLIQWLQGAEKKRTRVLFVEDGTIQEKLDIPLQSISIPPEEALNLLFARRNEILVEAENVLARLEDDNAFNRWLTSFLERRNLPFHRLIPLVAILGSLAGLFYLVYRLGIVSRFRHDTSVPVVTAELGRRFPDESLFLQRHNALTRHGNLREPASSLARQWFMRLGIEVDGREPKFDVSGPFWTRLRLRRRLLWFWRLAQGHLSRRLGAAELFSLQRELDTLTSSHARAGWRILPDDTLKTRAS